MLIPNVYEIAGLVVTIGAGLATYFRTSADKDSLRHTFFVAVLCTVLTLLVGIRYGVIPEIASQLKLQRQMSGCDGACELFGRYSTTVTNLKAQHDSDSLIAQEFEVRRVAMMEDLGNFSSGTFEVSRHEMPSFAIRMVESTKATIKATSYVASSDWWSTPWGKRYSAANYSAIKEKGVKIERTFIFSEVSEFEAMRKLLDEQQKQGIVINVVLAADLGPVVNDLVVIDDAIAGELTLTPEKSMNAAVFFTNVDDIARVDRKLHQIAVHAQPYTTSMKIKQP